MYTVSVGRKITEIPPPDGKLRTTLIRLAAFLVTMFVGYVLLMLALPMSAPLEKGLVQVVGAGVAASVSLTNWREGVKVLAFLGLVAVGFTVLLLM